MLRVKNQAGLVSLLEVIVTATVFTIAFVGIYVSMSMLHPQGNTSMEKLRAAYTAKGFLDELKYQVRADTWDSGNLVPGTYSTTYNGYLINYTISNVAGLNLRQVDLTITY